MPSGGLSTSSSSSSSSDTKLERLVRIRTSLSGQQGRSGEDGSVQAKSDSQLGDGENRGSSGPSRSGLRPLKRRIVAPVAELRSFDDIIEDISVAPSDDPPRSKLGDQLDEDLRDTNEYVYSEISCLEREQQQIDQQAQRIESQLRKRMGKGADSSKDGEDEEQERLLQEWFLLVNKKNALLRRQMQLNILEQEHDLDRRFQLLNRDLRAVMSIEDWQKTDEQRKREELLLLELVRIVDKRNELVDNLDEQERAIADDETIEDCVKDALKRDRRSPCRIH